ncbi:hypothetical protein RHECNPAF_930074 [Rhizobium etli CNPAF512]|nr:hypothetical protein RHECNPAF_930074 [Rhizobium etli CNPAF512]
MRSRLKIRNERQDTKCHRQLCRSAHQDAPAVARNEPGAACRADRRDLSASSKIRKGHQPHRRKSFAADRRSASHLTELLFRAGRLRAGGSARARWTGPHRSGRRIPADQRGTGPQSGFSEDRRSPYPCIDHRTGDGDGAGGKPWSDNLSLDRRHLPSVWGVTGQTGNLCRRSHQIERLQQNC